MGISENLPRGSIDRSIGTARELLSKGAQIVFYGKYSKEIITSESRLTDVTASERPRTTVGAPSTRESVSRLRGQALNPPDRKIYRQSKQNPPSVSSGRVINLERRLMSLIMCSGEHQWGSVGALCSVCQILTLY